MSTIEISGEKNKGQYIVVSDCDFLEVSKYKWFLSAKGYPKRNVWIDGKSTEIALHRLLTGFRSDVQVDHIDGNKLNNRRCNLRLCTSTQNSFNRELGRNNRSGFKGVYFRKDSKKWRAYISVNRLWKNLGHFATKEDAAKAYNVGAIIYHGDFARLNVI